MIGRIWACVVLLTLAAAETHADCWTVGDGECAYLSGQVVDERDNSPLTDVRVYLLWPHPGGTTFDVASLRYSDAEGRFRFAVPPGSWGLQFTPEYPAYDWEAYDNTKRGAEMTQFVFAGGEEVDLGAIPLGPPDFQILGAAVQVSAGRPEVEVELNAQLANNTSESAELSVWVVLEEESCTEPCAPALYGSFVEPLAPVRVETSAGAATPFTLQFSLPLRVLRGRQYLATVYAGISRWDALAYSPERLEVRVP